MVEVTFTVSPRVRRIAAHDPDELPLSEYYRQMYWGSGVDLPEEGYEAALDEVVARRCRAAAGREGGAVAAAAGRVRHRLRAGDACGAVHRRQGRADARAPEPVARPTTATHADSQTLEMRPGPLRLAAGEPDRPARAAGRLHRRRRAARPARPPAAVPDRQAPADQPDLPRPLPHRHARRRPAPEDHQPDLPVHRPARARPSSTSGSATSSPSTSCGRISRCCNEIVAAEAGAVVKTIGDAVMATFPTPDRAVAAALRMRDAMRELNEEQRQRGSAAQDRHPRGAVHRGDAERPAGLFRPDGQHRLARAGPRRSRSRSSPPGPSSRIRRPRPCSTPRVCTRGRRARPCAASMTSGRSTRSRERRRVPVSDAEHHPLPLSSSPTSRRRWGPRLERSASLRSRVSDRESGGRVR